MELKAAKLAIMSFTIKVKKAISVHLCMENMIVLSYLIKMGGVKGGRVPKTMSQWRSAKCLAICSGKTTLLVRAEMLFRYSELTSLCMRFPFFHTLEGFFRK